MHRDTPRGIYWMRLTSAVAGERKRAQQERNVVVRFIRVHSKCQYYFRKEGRSVPLSEVLRGSELEPVRSGSQYLWTQFLYPSVGIGLPDGNL